MAYERERQQLAASMLRQHGSLLEARCLSGGAIELVFEKEVVPIPNNHLMKFGYVGTGPSCFYNFLKAAGFNVTEREIETLSPPRTLKIDKTKIYDETYKRAVELRKLGEYEKAAEYARQAVHLARQISETARIPYSGSTAEALLELIESDIGAARMAAAELSKLLDDLGTTEWPQAVKALERIGEPAVLPLCDLINDSTADIKRRGLAASALGEIGDSRAINPLIKLLRDGALGSDKYAMRNLIFAFEHFNDLRIADAIKPLLYDKDQDISKAAEIVLAKYNVHRESGEVPRQDVQEGIVLEKHGRHKRWWEFWKR